MLIKKVQELVLPKSSQPSKKHKDQQEEQVKLHRSQAYSVTEREHCKLQIPINRKINTYVQQHCLWSTLSKLLG